jgi:hypothetical protein
LVRTPVLGGVENMAYFNCPCCGENSELHAPAPYERTIWASGVERLARLPFRPDAVIDAADLAASSMRWRRTSRRNPLVGRDPGDGADLYDINARAEPRSATSAS